VDRAKWTTLTKPSSGWLSHCAARYVERHFRSGSAEIRCLAICGNMIEKGFKLKTHSRRSALCIYIYTHTYIYISLIYIYVCVYVCIYIYIYLSGRRLQECIRTCERRWGSSSSCAACRGTKTSPPSQVNPKDTHLTCRD